MNNQVAAECCGSCEHCQCKWEWYCCYFQYEEKKKRLEELQAQIGDDWTENDEADDLHGELYDWEESNFKELTDSCTNHTPRNPIPIIELPGVRELVEENQLLNALFDMQQTRMKKAIKLWQQATGKKDVLPDLGVLLEWLMAESERLKEVAENWRSMEQASSLMASVRKVRVEKQRRHRKWALKKARNYLHNPCAMVVYDAGETRPRKNDWLI